MKCHVCRAGNLVRQQVGWECDKCRVAVLSAVPRYRIYPMPMAPVSVIETPDGEWCRWQDIQDEMTALRTLADRCRALCDELKAELAEARAASLEPEKYPGESEEVSE